MAAVSSVYIPEMQIRKSLSLKGRKGLGTAQGKQTESGGIKAWPLHTGTLTDRHLWVNRDVEEERDRQCLP